MDWDTINNFDVLTLWRSIDENLKLGYNTGPIQAEIAARQEELSNKDDISLFIEETKFVPTSDRKKATLSKFIFDRYVEWCNANGIKRTMAHQTLSKRLANKGFVYEVRRNELGTQRCVLGTFETQTPISLQDKPEFAPHLSAVKE